VYDEEKKRKEGRVGERKKEVKKRSEAKKF